MDFKSLSKIGFCDFSDFSIQQIIRYLIESYQEEYLVETTILTPNKENVKFNKTLSSAYGLQQFPYHTDGANILIPPRWVILEYLNDIPSKAGTLLLDTVSLQQQDRYYNFFYNEIYIVAGINGHFLTTVINKNLNNIPILRWNSMIMKLLSKMTIERPDLTNLEASHRVEWTGSKKILIDNWRILHSREKVETEESYQRIIKRTNLTPIIENAGI